MLKRVSIQTFKSLKAVTLDPQKVNPLIGPNNSGISNFLKALVSMSEIGDTNNQFSMPEEFRFLAEKLILVSWRSTLVASATFTDKE